MSAIVQKYSGIVLNQNAPVVGGVGWRSRLQAQTIYQTFHLPSNYELGTKTSELRYPDLSGFQIMVSIDDGYAFTASLSYSLDYYVNGSGWVNLAKGVSIGSHISGQCWIDVLFDESVPVNSMIANSQMRLGITSTSSIGQVIKQPVTSPSTDHYLVNGITVGAHLAPQTPYPITVSGVAGFLYNDQGAVTFSVQGGISDVWYTQSSPLSGGAFLSDGVTPLLGHGTNSSIAFRILGLVADQGTDLLGNEYRSCVINFAGTGGSNGQDHWTSNPQPSPFAVVSRYFDVRPTPVTPAIANINMIGDPSFEYDVYYSSPYLYYVYDHLVTRNNLIVTNSWSASGSQSLRSTSTFTGSSGAYSGVIVPGQGTQAYTAQGGAIYSASCEVDVLSLPASSTGVTITLSWYDANGALLSINASSGAASIGVQIISVQATAPATAAYVSVNIGCSSNSSGTLDFLIDAVLLTNGPLVPYFDGDTPGCAWLGQSGQSPSTQFAPSSPGESSVIDGVHMDPITQNMTFNVYYSLDDAHDSENMTESDWEQKLWTRVPKVFTATQSQQYIFPEPITAKYVKIEFTNLLARSYDPGSFQRPVTYKKFPTWVADYFILQMENPSFVANRVSVQNDALTLAYNYYLDDLHQSPDQPIPSAETLNTYFGQKDASGVVDAKTLEKINLSLSSFRVPSGSLVSPNSLLGSATHSIVGNVANSPSQTAEIVGGPNVNYSTVSTSQREPVIFEQSMPDMYFFIPCRHTYKELSATFQSGKAYYASVNDLSFMRSNYSVQTDTSIYIESGGDSVNAARNDFYVTPSGWTTYGG